MRPLILAAALLASAFPATARKAKVPKIPGPQGTLQIFASPRDKVRSAVDEVFSEFAAQGWGVRAGRDAVHGAWSNERVSLAMHAYFSDAAEGATGVELVYESRHMPKKQRRLIERDILRNVEKKLKETAASRKAP